VCGRARARARARMCMCISCLYIENFHFFNSFYKKWFDVIIFLYLCKIEVVTFARVINGNLK